MAYTRYICALSPLVLGSIERSRSVTQLSPQCCLIDAGRTMNTFIMEAILVVVVVDVCLSSLPVQMNSPRATVSHAYSIYISAARRLRGDMSRWWCDSFGGTI